MAGPTTGTCGFSALQRAHHAPGERAAEEPRRELASLVCRQYRSQPRLQVRQPLVRPPKLPPEHLPPCLVPGGRSVQLGLVGSYLARQLGAYALDGLIFVAARHWVGLAFHVFVLIMICKGFQAARQLDRSRTYA